MRPWTDARTAATVDRMLRVPTRRPPTRTPVPSGTTASAPVATAIRYLDGRSVSSPLALRTIAPPGGDRATDATPLVRTADILGGLTVALDLTEGLPPGHAMRTAYLAMRVADRLGMDDRTRGSLFHAALLKDAGCSSNAAMVAELFGGDDAQTKGRQLLTDRSVIAQAIFVVRNLPPTDPLPLRIRRFASIIRRGGTARRRMEQTRCERGASITRKAGFPDEVALAVHDVHEHWDGRGQPQGLARHAISPIARIIAPSQCLALFASVRGADEALRVLRARRGTWYEPDITDALTSACASGLLADLEAPDLPRRLAELEPASQVRELDEAGIDQLAGAFADVIDAKSPFTGSHSRRVAQVADALALRMGLPPATRVDIRRAGLLHDIGKLGVPNVILDKPGRLDASEMELIRRHPELALRILGAVPRFHAVAELAACHHERLDGAGYFRGLGGESLGAGARIIAVADVFEALTADRPYRMAMDPEAALGLMRRDAGDHLAREVLAVLPDVLARD